MSPRQGAEDMKRSVKTIILAAACLYLAACGLMFAFQRSLQYFPDAAAMATPGDGFATLSLQTADGENLVAWWAAPAAPARPVILYLHGNGANLTARLARFRGLAAAGYGLMAPSWRGYGGSTGTPTEAGLMADARSAFAELRRRAPGARVVIVGESLGTAVATKLAAETQAAGLILDSSFSAAVDIAARGYPWLPVRLLMLDRFDAAAAAPEVTAPVLQLHCRDDPVTPLDLAETLGRAFPTPPSMTMVESQCHVVPIGTFLPAVTAFADTLSP